MAVIPKRLEDGKLVDAPPAERQVASVPHLNYSCLQRGLNSSLAALQAQVKVCTDRWLIPLSLGFHQMKDYQVELQSISYRDRGLD